MPAARQNMIGFQAEAAGAGGVRSRTGSVRAPVAGNSSREAVLQGDEAENGENVRQEQLDQDERGNNGESRRDIISPAP
jgi:hypothetical protein